MRRSVLNSRISVFLVVVMLISTMVNNISSIYASELEDITVQTETIGTEVTTDSAIKIEPIEPVETLEETVLTNEGETVEENIVEDKVEELGEESTETTGEEQPNLPIEETDETVVPIVDESNGELTMPDNVVDETNVNSLMTTMEVIEEKHRVYYSLSGGEEGIIEQDNLLYKTGNIVTVQSCAAYKPGFRFAGWEDRTTGTIYQSKDEFVMGDVDVELFATWFELEDIEYLHSLSFTVKPVWREGETITKSDLVVKAFYYNDRTMASREEEVTDYTYNLTETLTTEVVRPNSSNSVELIVEFGGLSKSKDIKVYPSIEEIRVGYNTGSTIEIDGVQRYDFVEVGWDYQEDKSRFLYVEYTKDGVNWVYTSDYNVVGPIGEVVMTDSGRVTIEVEYGGIHKTLDFLVLEEIEIPSYRVFYEKMQGHQGILGSDPVDSINYHEGSTIILKKNPYILENYEFKWWVDKLTGDIYSDLSEFTIPARNTTLIGYMERIDLTDYSYEEKAEGIVITSYLGLGGDVEVPQIIGGKPVIEIGGGAFRNKNITSLILPSTIKKIGIYAFSSNAIKELNTPNDLVEIGDNAFAYNNIDKLTLNDGLQIVGVEAFIGNNIEDLIIPGSLKIIENAVFASNKIKSLIILEGVEEIKENTFGGNNIIDLVLPSTLRSIGRNGFSTNNLHQVTLPTNLEYIGVSAFRNNRIQMLTIPENVLSILSNAFGGTNEVTFVDIKAVNLDISKDVFGFTSNAQNIRELYLLNGVGVYEAKDNIPTGEWGVGSSTQRITIKLETKDIGLKYNFNMTLNNPNANSFNEEGIVPWVFYPEDIVSFSVFTGLPATTHRLNSIKIYENGEETYKFNEFHGGTGAWTDLSNIRLADIVNSAADTEITVYYEVEKIRTMNIFTKLVSEIRDDLEISGEFSWGPKIESDYFSSGNYFSTPYSDFKNIIAGEYFNIYNVDNWLPYYITDDGYIPSKGVINIQDTIYEFKGFEIEGNSNIIFENLNEIELQVFDDTNIYVKIDELPVGTPTYTVTYNNGDIPPGMFVTLPNTLEYEEGEEVSVRYALLGREYIKGFYSPELDKTFKSSNVFNMPASNINLIAQYKVFGKVYYDIGIDMEGLEAPEDSTDYLIDNLNSSISFMTKEPPQIEVTDTNGVVYRFKHWLNINNFATYNSKSYANSNAVEGQIRLIGVWEQIVQPSIEGTITIKCVDENNAILNQETITVSEGSHSIYAKIIEGYNLNDTSTKIAEITKEKTEVEVIFNYKKIVEIPTIIEGKIIVKYVDENNVILGQEIITVNEGSHTVVAKEIDGYKLIYTPIKTVEITKDITEIEVIFNYEKIIEIPPIKPEITGTITIKYIDENKNLLNQEVVIVKEGVHSYSAKVIEGYNLNDSKIKSVEITKDTTTAEIVFNYEKIKEIVKGKITVKYVDENNNELGLDELTVEIGLHNVAAKDFEGYNLDDNKTKTVEITEVETEKEVIFKYKKIEKPAPIEPKPETPEDKSETKPEPKPQPQQKPEEPIVVDEPKPEPQPEPVIEEPVVIEEQVPTPTPEPVVEESVIIEKQQPKPVIEVKKEEDIEKITGKVSGKIIGIDGKPLAYVKVELHSNPRVTYTDMNGYYEFNDIELGNHSIYVMNPITNEELGSIKVFVKSTEKVKEMDIKETVISEGINLNEDNLEEVVDIKLEIYIEEIPEIIEESIQEPEPRPLPIIPIVAATSGFFFIVFVFLRKRRIFAYIYDDEKLVDKVKLKKSCEITLEVDEEYTAKIVIKQKNIKKLEGNKLIVLNLYKIILKEIEIVASEEDLVIRL